MTKGGKTMARFFSVETLLAPLLCCSLAGFLGYDVGADEVPVVVLEGPDLAGSVEAYSVQQFGRVVELHLRVDNVGDEWSGPFVNVLYGANFEVIAVSTHNLAPGNGRTVILRGAPPTPVLGSVVFSVIDAFNQVEESDEGNSFNAMLVR